MTDIVLCQKCSGTTIIRQQKTYNYGQVNHRYCKQCGYRGRYRITPDGEEYIGDVMMLTPESLEKRRFVKDTLFRLERGGKTPIWVLDALRSAGRKIGVI